MASFDPIVGMALHAVGARRIVEVGAEGAVFSSWLAEYAETHDGDVRCVDPAPSERLRDLGARHPNVSLIERCSPEALEELQDADAYFLDGDHNWHVVTGELRGLRGRLMDDEQPALVILHDVEWPCARRDFYYEPDRIPVEARQAYSYRSGVAPGNHGLDSHGLRGGGVFAIAEREGGARNGVLTAVEDFMSQTPGLVHRVVPCAFGLGFLYRNDAPWAARLDALLEPWDRSPLLKRLEANRIALYLQVLRLQDEIDRRAADSARVIGALRRRLAEVEAAAGARIDGAGTDRDERAAG